MKKIAYLLWGILLMCTVSCEDDADLSSRLTGCWVQNQVFVDDQLQDLTDGECNTSLLIEANGVYRLFDGVTHREHFGTWLFSDGEWMNMSMDRIQGENSDETYNFGQTLVRFTILEVNDNRLELRIKTFLRNRKNTVMFNLMEQDNTEGMTGEELLQLDTENKKLHTYRYVFKRKD